MKKILFILFFISGSLIAQTNTDSLFKIWLNTKNHDTVRLKAYDRYIHEKYLFSAPDTAYLLASDELNYAQKKGLKKEAANALNILGISQAIQGNYDKAIEHFESSISLRYEIKDINGVANSTNNLGLIYGDLGQTEKAIECYEKSLAIYEKKSNYKGITSSLTNIGMAYHNLGDYKNAIEYYSRSLKLSERKKDKHLIAVTLNNIAIIHIDQNEYDLALKELEKCKGIFIETGNDYELGSVYSYFGNIMEKKGKPEKALEYYEKGLELKEKVGDLGGIGNLNANIGGIFKAKKEYTTALEYYELALKYNTEGGMIQQISGCYNNIGLIHFEMGDLKKAISNCESALKIAEEHFFAAEIADASESLWNIYKKTGDKGKALAMFEKYISTRDTLKSEENQKAIIQQQFQYQYELQAAEDSLKNEKEKKVKDAEINQQKAELKAKRTQQILLFGGLGLFVIFSIFIYNRFRLTQKQNKIIEEQKHVVEEKNKEITDSINYAKRIQEAILPSRKSLNDNLKNGFVLYKPKDIVAGDFYWLETVNSINPNIIYFAAADCTGHGVPGALVSVVCSNAISKALLEEGISETGKILDRTRELVIEKFSKSEENVKDGMDISLCRLDIAAKKLQWSGANNPIWIIRNGELMETKPDLSAETSNKNPNQSKYILIEVKADKQPIGNYADTKPFTTHDIELKTGDTIYVFTDGFQDQFGGEKGKKFKASKFKELLLSVQNEKMDDQKIIIDQEFEKWRGSLEQNDDVCVIGVKI